MSNPESPAGVVTAVAAEADAAPASYSKRYRWYVLAVMTLAFTFYTADRVLLGVLVQPIKNEFGVSDSQMGFVSLLVSASYALFVIPFGLLADRVNRRNLLAAILTGWSAMTVLTGFTRNLVQLALAQMVVAVNEAGAAPTMNSLISDLFARAKRGLPIAIWYCGIAGGPSSATPSVVVWPKPMAGVSPSLRWDCRAWRLAC
jgi:sugar phosphate permease